MAKTMIQVDGLQLSYGARKVLDIDHFALMEGERVGLVGENGAGKSTFLRVLAEEIRPDAGQVRRLAPFSYIPQMDEGGLPPVAADPLDNGAGRLSGGERTRRRVAQALAKPAEFLLADEPTADLDWQGLSLLEKALFAYQGAILLVSHDRALLNKLCTRIAQLEDGRLTSFPGGFESYLAERENRRRYKMFQYDQYQRESARLKAAIQDKREKADQVKKAPSRMGNSESRLHKRESTASRKKLNQAGNALATRLEMLDKPLQPREETRVLMGLGSFSPLISRTALSGQEITLRFPGRALLSQASFTVPALSHTLLLGPNGCGKTTLAQRIVQGDPRIRRAPGLSIGYFGQDHQTTLALEKTALDNAMEGAFAGQDAVRTVLARLGLRGDAVFKRAGVLSGGERAKLALARLMVGRYNLLLLDEPTNHLDLYAMEALEQMLISYQGTVMLITHDRQMAQRVGNRLLRFEGQALVAFEGTLAQERERELAQAQSHSTLERMRLELRLAELAGRIASPRRGEDVAALRRQYDEVAKMKKSLDS